MTSSSRITWSIDRSVLPRSPSSGRWSKCPNDELAGLSALPQRRLLSEVRIADGQQRPLDGIAKENDSQMANRES
jgi:hypothetical protein